LGKKHLGAQTLRLEHPPSISGYAKLYQDAAKVLQAQAE